MDGWQTLAANWLKTTIKFVRDKVQSGGTFWQDYLEIATKMMRKWFPNVLREGSPKGSAMTFRDEEIEEVIKDGTRLPSTHRRGYPSSTDDVAEGTDGNPTKVPTSGNPDDRFKE